MRFIITLRGLALVGACAAHPYAAMAQSAPAAPGNTSAASVSPAQAAATLATIKRVEGEVIAVSAASLSIREADGRIVQVVIEPNANIITSRTIAANDIHPGDFVAAANANIDDRSGRSASLNVFPPGVRRGEGSYAMQQPNMTMTNATVVEVVDITDGRDLLVRYPGGERHIIIPADARVARQTSVDIAQIGPGAHVRAFARPDADGALSTGYITVEPTDAPPAR
jgi:hypothetical protein